MPASQALPLNYGDKMKSTDNLAHGRIPCCSRGTCEACCDRQGFSSETIARLTDLEMFGLRWQGAIQGCAAGLLQVSFAIASRWMVKVGCPCARKSRFCVTFRRRRFRRHRTAAATSRRRTAGSACRQCPSSGRSSNRYWPAPPRPARRPSGRSVPRRC
jgi:hypothetical protein